MEVHPPHHPLHTWKDFFIHIATITVGLLIAIGLEQSVEALHHRHQRHQLEEELRDEGERNREIVRKDLAYRDAFMQWDLRVNEWAKNAATGPVPALPARPDDDADFRASFRYVVPGNSVWSVAKAGGLVALLPSSEARVYTRLYRVHELVTELDLEDRKANIAYRGAMAGIVDPGAAHGAIADALTREQRMEVSAAALHMYAASSALRTMLVVFDGANEAVLGGASTEDEVVEGIYRAQYGSNRKEPSPSR